MTTDPEPRVQQFIVPEQRRFDLVPNRQIAEMPWEDWLAWKEAYTALARHLEAAETALLPLAECGVESDDPRLGYVVIQVDPGAVEAARAYFAAYPDTEPNP